MREDSVEKTGTAGLSLRAPFDLVARAREVPSLRGTSCSRKRVLRQTATPGFVKAPQSCKNLGQSHKKTTKNFQLETKLGVKKTWLSLVLFYSKGKIWVRRDLTTEFYLRSTTPLIFAGLSLPQIFTKVLSFRPPTVTRSLLLKTRTKSAEMPDSAAQSRYLCSQYAFRSL